MIRKALVTAVIGATGMAIPVGAAMAEPPTGCGAGSELMTIAQAVESIDNRFGLDEAEVTAEIQTKTDKNDDDFVCVKHFKPNRGQDQKYDAEDVIFTLVNDNNAGPKN